METQEGQEAHSSCSRQKVMPSYSTSVALTSCCLKKQTDNKRMREIKDEQVNKTRSLLELPICPFLWGCSIKASNPRTSLVVQWVRIRLPMQGMQIRSLIGK